MLGNPFNRGFFKEGENKFSNWKDRKDLGKHNNNDPGWKEERHQVKTSSLVVNFQQQSHCILQSDSKNNTVESQTF